MENTDEKLVKRRRIALIEADLSIEDIRKRWEEKFGNCSWSLAGQVAVYGTTRSHQKELDLCELVGKDHDYLFTEARVRDAVEAE